MCIFALNRQVFGLIVFNSFFPHSGFSSGQGSAIDYTASLNEFFSRQLSQLLTGVVKQALSDVGFVSDIQLNVGYKQVQKYIGKPTQGGGEFNFESTVDFLDAVRIRYKAVYANASITNNSPYLDNEIDVEIIKTGIDGLRFKIYLAQDHYINNIPRLNLGLGVTYETEFDTLTWRNLIY